MKKMLLIVTIVFGSSSFNLQAEQPSRVIEKEHNCSHKKNMEGKKHHCKKMESHKLFKELKLTKQQKQKLKKIKKEKRHTNRNDLKGLEKRLKLTESQKIELELFKKEKRKENRKEIKETLKH
jgi:Spy/CpxP family protein refolding chaperone